jgi:DNA repair exonuclease SbcCD ATPase subunit
MGNFFSAHSKECAEKKFSISKSQIFIVFFPILCKVTEKFGGISMKNSKYLITIMVIITLLTISKAMGDDNPQKENDQKKIQKPAAPKKQKSSAIEKKIDDLIRQQKQQKKTILTLDKGIKQQVSLQKKSQSDVSQQFKAIQQQIDDQWKQFSDRNKSNQALIRSEIDNQINTLLANFNTSLSQVAQNVNKTLLTDRNDRENNINAIRGLVKDVQTALLSDQSNRYSALEKSGENIRSTMEAMVEQLSQFNNQISQDKPDLQQIINDQLTALQDRLNAIETNVKNLISNSNAKLNSDLNDTIRQLKNDLNQFQQNIDDAMDKMSSQVLEIKHEQQIELQSLVKQLTKELNRHDQNITDSLIKAENTLDTSHLAWIIYALLFLIVCLIIFIVWDRISTVEPLIARIRKLEDNLVIEY